MLFKRAIPPQDRDPDLVVKLTTDAELESLLVYAVLALRNLMQRGSLEIPKSVEAERERYRNELDSVAGFIAESCEIGEHRFVLRANFYRSYKSWCADSGRGSLSKTHVYDRMENPEMAKRGITQVRRNIGEGYAGITLQEGAA